MLTQRPKILAGPQNRIVVGQITFFAIAAEKVIQAAASDVAVAHQVQAADRILRFRIERPERRAGGGFNEIAIA